MRKAPPADDRHVDFLALAERGPSPLKILHNPYLALSGFVSGCIPPPFRPSKAQNTLACENALSADERYARAQQLLYYVPTSTDEFIISADAIPAPFEDPGRRRIEFSGNAEIWSLANILRGPRCFFRASNALTIDFDSGAGYRDFNFVVLCARRIKTARIQCVPSFPFPPHIPPPPFTSILTFLSIPTTLSTPYISIQSLPSTAHYPAAHSHA
ncbi:hypothetical protein C8R43DRAFT_1139056 [Mycena crocata]|nr:hypothetical protein C8R43DRAFT_1139056 [Mycena crocata]